MDKVPWNLYKATTKFFSLSKLAVFHGREDKHDFVKTVPGKLKNACCFIKTSPIHCILMDQHDILLIPVH